MALGKILNLGGIENSSPRADQSPNGFRVARNVMPTPDGSVIPRYHWTEPDGQPSDIKSVCHICQYNQDALILAEKQAFLGADATFELYKNNTKIPLNSYIGLAPEVPYGGMDLQQSYRINNTTYFLNPYGGSLFKYDGVELGYAGCNQPIFSTSGYLSTGTRFIKVIQHTFDFDNNEPVSEYVQFPTSSTNVPIQASSIVPTGFTYMPSNNTGVIPTAQISSQGYNGNYFLGTVEYIPSNQSYIVTYKKSREAINAIAGTSVAVTAIVAARNGTFTSGNTTVTVPAIVPARNGTLTVLGNIVTGLSSTLDLKVGMRVFGATVPSPTFIQRILSSTSILVSADIPAGTQSLSFSDLQVGMRIFGATVPSPAFINSVVSSTSIVISTSLTPTGTQSISFSDLDLGVKVFGTGIPAGTTITAIPSSTVITLSNTIPIGARDIYFEYNNTNITSDRVGSYVFVAATQSEMLDMGFSSLERGLALKVKSVDPLTLDATNSKVLSEDRTWNTLLTALVTLDLYVTYGTRTFFTYWESGSSDGVFFYRKIYPSFPNNTSSIDSFPVRQILTTTGTALATAGSLDTMFLMGPILNDWYNVNTKKLSPNSVGVDLGIGEFRSLTKYQDMLLMANDQLIWFSDTSLGGWVEQFESGTSILVGDMEYGKITSICGTGDFLFVGRERKNYYVNGNIATGNYRVQEIADIQVGPWNNVSSLQVKDSVVFINSLGIFSVAQGGTVSELSKKCKKNFDSFNPINIDEDVSFRLLGSASQYPNLGIASAYDQYRGLVVFMKREEGNPCLVLNTNNGEVYEWDGVYVSDEGIYANCIQFIFGRYYLGGTDSSVSPSYTSIAKYAVEDTTASRNYTTEYPVKMYTTWLTAGEPSLEKEVLQLKLFGRISASSKGLVVKHYKDWNKNTAITNTEYFPIDTTLGLDDQVQFSHKKRLNSDKCLAASVGIEINDPSIDFELESFEVEFNSIQSGMKR
jgi:hypothetical protein